MNYQNIYDSLISKRQIKLLRKKTCYCESHHIVPKALGGTDLLSNKINLTAREHYIAHLLLERITRIKYGINSREHLSMLSAIWRMSSYSKYNRITSRTYQQLRIQFSQAISISLKGIKRKPLSKERKEQNRKDSQNRIWMKNEQIHVSHFVRKEDIQEYLNKGYVYGRIIDQTGDKNPMHNYKFSKDECEKRSKRTALRNRNSKWIFNPTTGESKFVEISQIENYLSNGFRFGQKPRNINKRRSSCRMQNADGKFTFCLENSIIQQLNQEKETNQ